MSSTSFEYKQDITKLYQWDSLCTLIFRIRFRRPDNLLWVEEPVQAEDHLTVELVGLLDLEAVLLTVLRQL